MKNKLTFKKIKMVNIMNIYLYLIYIVKIMIHIVPLKICQKQSGIFIRNPDI